MEVIDLRSDTVTVPTEEMRRAMALAEVGDDVYRDDPTVNRLEELAAEKVGKEAALFVPSGTMGNLIAVLTHTRAGDEVVVEQEAHIYYYEVGGMAALGGVQARPLPGVRGALQPGDVENAIRGDNIHFPRTSLVCLENTHNRAGGAVIKPESVAAVAGVAHKHGLAVHLDGARVFNAAVALGVNVKQLTGHVDSIMFCLSKGLAAPVGSLVAGTRDWIEKARKKRKMLGGGMRQAGILAAAGIIALERMVDRLEEDHANARQLAEALASMQGIDLDPSQVETNMVLFSLKNIPADEFVKRLQDRSVLVNSMGPDRVRLVTHKEITSEDIEKALNRIQDALKV